MKTFLLFTVMSFLTVFSLGFASEQNADDNTKEQIGIASFYAKVVKSRMANGMRYHKDSMICAHRTHPFGTLLKVTNLKNNKTVVVKVTDRGPFARGRIIDLSWGAAEKLGFIAAGLTKVKVEVYDGKMNSEIDTHPNDSTDLIIDYENREGYEFPYTPTQNLSQATRR